MRIVSWIVVLGSLAWILANNLQSVEEAVVIPDVPPAQASGTALSRRGAAQAFNIDQLASSYTKAWNSHEPSEVAAHYSDQGQIVINGLETFKGRKGLEQMAAGFMESFPDLTLKLRQVEKKHERFVFHWALTGTHQKTGSAVILDGSETWLLDSNGLILESEGSFDAESLSEQTGGSE